MKNDSVEKQDVEDEVVVATTMAGLDINDISDCDNGGCVCVRTEFTLNVQ